MIKSKNRRVNYAYQGNTRVPYIPLKGKWLKEAGFECGTKT